MELGLKIPRELRMFVLRETLREKVIETRKSRLTLADELNYRLSWYTEFTETQLENLLIFFNDPKIDREFLEDFWIDLISYLVNKEVSSNHLKTLLDNSITYVKKHGLELPDMKTYNFNLKDLFFDSFGRIDGLAPAKFRPVLFKSSTLSEVRNLGVKYEVDVPRRLKKTELADIIIKELKDRGQHTDKLEGEIRSMSVLVMQRFATDHDIKASTELKKEEIIEYILANAKETKETYFVPESQAAYDMEVEEVAEHLDETFESESFAEEIIEDEPIIAPTPEVIIEEVADQPVVEEQISEPLEEQPKSQVEFEASGISELTQEIKMLREAIENILLSQKVQTTEKEAKVHTTHSDVSKSGIPETEPMIVNSVEFYGDSKSLKRVIKNDEASEREKFIEEKKAESSIGTGKNEETGKKSKGSRPVGKFFAKISKVLLKYVLILIVIVVLLVFIIAAIKHFVPSITLLDGVITFLNNFLGSGLITRINNLLGW